MEVLAMNIPYYQVDAFTDSVFGGNPAGVCLLDGWLPDTLLQNIGAENNLSETAFLVASGSDYELRWFTPELEVDLCGHATLASAHVLFSYVDPALREVTFHTNSGPLRVTGGGDRLAMDFPSRPPEVVTAPAALLEGLGATPVAVLRSRDYLALYDSEEAVENLSPQFDRFLELDTLGVIATAPGTDTDTDFVSRFFAPKAGIDEDPVTGSAHCTLIPYWADRLGKTDLVARQISARGGLLFCRNEGERVRIAGRAATFLTGEITVNGSGE
jgi:PhzF family phenazine biosynthesis protein